MTNNSHTEDRRRDRRRLAVATLAFLGIGAGLTTAAWTDQVWFSAGAQAATFNLQGSLSSSGPWDEYATEGEALEIPIDSSGFAELLPGGEPVTTTVYVKNDSSVPTTIDVTTTTTGDLFTEDSTVEVAAEPGQTTLEPGAYTEIDVTVTPGEMPDTLRGAEGTITLKVTGTQG
ncbi:hypothetical protein H9651_08220 [Microbacterium sp. Sa4CUA7]|uniref:PLAT domain-containing protein n=1 Tax=Microbacterium pullorum TaxID=2762236 RepID=A0ABR8S2B2_9MICO|nr:hypothetical protein [Microbacterium pullorum]MBD7957622.1 hypothetical protein [Microbacterium pullorum]